MCPSQLEPVAARSGHRPMADDAAVATLLGRLEAHGPLKRAYVPLRESLPDELLGFGASRVHTLVLAAVRSLLERPTAPPEDKDQCPDSPKWTGDQYVA